MSRANVPDNSTDVSLFPFLAVLICTMGSLLVVLVAVTRLSRDKAVEQANVPQAPSAVSGLAAEKAARKRREVEKYNAYLEEVRSEAEKKLRDDQLRLSHIEDHIRRLQEQLEAHQYAAAELAALKDEHSHDHEQAEREVARLKKLIEETRENIEKLRSEEDTTPRSYAVVPYEGPHGTRRRPIYIECRENQVILQPEGIELTPEDFLPPLGPGNPLASALRAAREYIARESPVADTGKDTQAYPLILVRPDGIAAYYRVRDAIESWDADFGYEMIDGDWEIEFPPPNPQLADAEYRAVEIARARERMLAAAAPRAYGMARSARGAGFNVDVPYEEDESATGGYGGYGSGNGGSPGGGTGLGGEDDDGMSGDSMVVGSTVGGEGLGSDEGFGQSGDGSGGGPAGPQGDQLGGGPNGSSTQGDVTGSGEPGASAEGDPTGSAMTDGPGGAAQSAVGEPGNSPGGSSGQSESEQFANGGASGSGGSSHGDAKGSGGSSSSLASTGSASGGSATPGSGSSASSNPEGNPGTISFEQTYGQPAENVASVRGKDWAIGGVKRDAIPIRRSIQVVVRKDCIAILPERTTKSASTAGGKEIHINGTTAAAVDELVVALRDTMRGWGMAGQGLYWRPVVVLNVGPDGQRRADDLTELLHNSGIELRRASATAQLDEGSNSSATTR